MVWLIPSTVPPGDVLPDDMFPLKKTFVTLMLLLALMLQGQVQAAGVRCGPVPAHTGSAAVHAILSNTDTAVHEHDGAHQGHHPSGNVQAEGARSERHGATIDSAAMHEAAASHGDCSPLAACCHGAAPPSPQVSLQPLSCSMGILPHPIQKPAMTFVARLERPPISLSS